VTPSYVPERGDLVWLTFTPQAGHEQAGHEQAGRRPALVLSPKSYNSKVGLALFCPVTNQVKGYPFEVALPSGLNVSGVVLADQVRNLDWQARHIVYIGSAPETLLVEVVQKLTTLL
jgi:mRNA interferase MazF